MAPILHSKLRFLANQLSFEGCPILTSATIGILFIGNMRHETCFLVCATSLQANHVRIAPAKYLQQLPTKDSESTSVIMRT